jgi:outer membrane lipoprotein-sorting protein
MWLLTKTIFLLVLVTGNLLAADSDPKAIELLKKSESLMRSDATLAEYQVDIIRPDWQRHMTFRSHDDMRDNRFRMEILSPRKTRGTVFLKVDNTLSMYLPKLERRINISPAMMQDPWMGSDFNNQDLLETDSLIDHYTHRIISTEEKDGVTIYSIESTPLPTATITWRKLIHQVSGDGLPISLEYHCDKKVSRRMVFDQVREVSGRTIPTRWTMTPLDDTGKRTVITLTAIEFDTNLDDALFNPGSKGAR